MNYTALRRITLGLFLSIVALAADDHHSWTLEITEDFTKGAASWQTTDDSAWKISKERDNAVLELTKKRSDYKPPHRSPFNIALRKDLLLSDFELTAKVKTTHESYGHRDLCFFFGYQDPAHFHYVHLGQKTDDHANQIFIVNGAPRVKISSKTTKGTPWKDDHWHTVKIIRKVESGLIQVFFDDMTTPVMEATDKTFVWGQVGFGSFDDTGMWDDIQINGKLTKKP